MGFFNRFAEYGDITKPTNCKWCGRKLRKKWREEVAPYVARWVEADQHMSGHAIIPEFWPSVKLGEPTLGDYRDGHFCGLRCGYMFGRWHADHGSLLAVKTGTRSAKPGT